MSEAPWKGKATQQEPAVTVVEAEPTSAGVDFSAMVPVGPSAIAEVEEPEISTGNRTYSSQPHLDASEILIPRLRLAQGLTQEVMNGDVKAGVWLLMGQKPTDKVELVVLAMGRARELRDMKADGQPILCQSPDGIWGTGDPGGECAKCPMAQWGTGGQRGKNSPPPCTGIYSYQCYSLTHQQLCLLEFKRTGLNTAKQINTMIMMRGVGNFVIELGSNQVKSNRGTFYQAAATAREITPDERAGALASAPTT